MTIFTIVFNVSKTIHMRFRGRENQYELPELISQLTNVTVEVNQYDN